MKNVLVTFLLFISITAAAQDLEKIKSNLEEQQQAWNSYDIESFMKHYWKSEQLTFVSKSGVMYGWEATRDRYYKNYPDKDAMGQLQFEIIELYLTSDTSAILIGSWALERPKNGNIGGYFTLIWRKIDGDWKIISDHTS